MSKELTDICRVRVKFSETDAMQRVWHGSYVTYFEDGRESFGRHYSGIGYADIQRSGIYAPVNDVAEIHTRYVPKPGARLDFEYEVYREEGHVLCATGSTTQLFIDPAGQLLLDLPDYYIRWKERFIGVD